MLSAWRDPKFKTAQAALNCPAGSTLRSGQCTSNTPSSYACPAGQTLGGNGAQCYTYGQVGTSYSCPRGGVVSGGSCVATGTSMISAINNCSPGYVYSNECRINESLPIDPTAAGLLPCGLNGWGVQFPTLSGVIICALGFSSGTARFPVYSDFAGNYSYAATPQPPSTATS